MLQHEGENLINKNQYEIENFFIVFICFKYPIHKDTILIIDKFFYVIPIEVKTLKKIHSCLSRLLFLAKSNRRFAAI